MKKKEEATEATPTQDRNKGTDNIRDKQRVFRAFFECPKTRAQVSSELDIWINSICYYVGMMQDKGQIKVHHLGTCPVKGSHDVEFLTTDPSLFPKERQLSFFDVLWKKGVTDE